MALGELWIEGQRLKGNADAVKEGKALIERYGDIQINDLGKLLNSYSSKLLKIGVKEYKMNPDSLEKAVSFWRAFWFKNGIKIDRAIEVPDPSITGADMVRARESGSALIFIPEAVSTQEGRSLLGKMFPRMHGDSVREGNFYANRSNVWGWRWFKPIPEALVVDFDKSQILRPTLNEYIVVSQATKLLTGKYLDENSWCYIPGTFYPPNVRVFAGFHTNGELNIKLTSTPHESVRTRYSRSVG
jgi:hypothetical protein